MAKARKCSVLSAVKKREILAIVSVGCGRRTAAAYVGCEPSLLTREMKKDAAFAAEMQRHESNPEIGFVRNIKDAAQKAQYWRAAAWWLERRNPEDFGSKKPGVVTVAQIQELLSGLTQIITEEVPIDKFRKNILKRVEIMVAEFLGNLGKRKCRVVVRPADEEDGTETSETNAGDESHE